MADACAGLTKANAMVGQNRAQLRMVDLKVQPVGALCAQPAAKARSTVLPAWCKPFEPQIEGVIFAGDDVAEARVAGGWRGFEDRARL